MTRVGLAVMRIQPLSLGHLWIIGQMIAECETAIIGVGSTQAAKDIHNPWDFEQRKQMLRNVYGDRLKIVPVADLGTDSTTTDWCEYVLGKIEKLGLPQPTDYYTGSQADAIWYKKHFFSEEEIYTKVREINSYPDFVDSEVTAEEFNRLHIRHRDTNPFLPATDIRTFIKLGSDEWKQWTPRVNHALIAETFPQNLITK